MMSVKRKQFTRFTLPSPFSIFKIKTLQLTMQVETEALNWPLEFFIRTLNWDSRWERGFLRSSGFLGCSCGAPVFWRVSRCGKEMSSFQHTEYSSYALRYTSFLHSVHYGSVKGDNLRPLATAVKHAAL